MTTVDPSYQQAAWSWVRHLRGGGTTEWQAWARQPDKHLAEHPPDQHGPSELPGAAVLELLRLMAVAWPAASPGFGELADMVLDRSGPGRGLGRQPLCWPGGSHAAIGPPPVDPVEVPRRELVRGAVGVLAELLLASPSGFAVTTPRRRRLLDRSPAFQLDGAPITAAAAQLGLARAGRREGGRDPRVLVFGVPFDHALQQAWSARVQRGSTAAWPRFVARWAGRDRVPPSADLPRLLAGWSDRVGAERVHLIALPRHGHALDEAATLLDGHPPDPSQGPRRALAGTFTHPRFAPLAPEAVDLTRRVNAVLDVRVAGERRAQLTRLLVSAVEDDHRDLVGVAVPQQHRDWVRDRAGRIADEVQAGGYAVRGDLADLMPRFDAVRPRPRMGGVLAVAVETCVNQALTNAEMRRRTTGQRP